MSKVKLSLVAVIALSSLSINSQANSLEDTLKKGTFKGQLKSYYFNKDTKTAQSADILMAGGLFSYVTGDFYGSSIGATVQSAYKLTNDDTTDSQFAGDMDTSDSRFSEIYFNYKINKTSIKFGRQFIGTPLLAGSGSRIVREAFQGTTITNNDLEKTSITLINVNKFQARTDGNGDIGKFNKDFNTVGVGGFFRLNDGANSIYIKNNSFNSLTEIGIKSSE